jgi:hypothetical protein
VLADVRRVVESMGLTAVWTKAERGLDTSMSEAGDLGAVAELRENLEFLIWSSQC